MLLEQKAGKLTVRVYDTRTELGDAAAQDAVAALQACIRAKGRATVIFAAAPSQNEFLEALCAADVDWTCVRAFHMDEYIGLPSDAPQGFGNFLKRAIFSRVPFQEVLYINGNAPVIEAEIARYSALLEQTPPDIVFMGIGENGHIAFNDPHMAHFDDDCQMKVVTLDDKCRQQQVNDGCFDKLADVPKQALTLTIPALMAAEVVFCMVPAATKETAVTKAVLGEIRETLPASILRLHPHATLYLDRESGKGVLQACSGCNGKG